jgi:hypothetical protein
MRFHGSPIQAQSPYQKQQIAPQHRCPVGATEAPAVMLLTHSKALAAANNGESIMASQFGRSLRFLEPARLAESVEVWDLLEPCGNLRKKRRWVFTKSSIEEIKAQIEPSLSVSIPFRPVSGKAQTQRPDRAHMKAFKWCRGYFREVPGRSQFRFEVRTLPTPLRI